MEEIRIAILDNNNSTIVFMDNTLPEALHYYNDELHSYLQGTTDMFSFTSPSDHPYAKYLKAGNKLAFRRKSGGSGAKWKHYYLNIMTVEQDEYEVNVEASGTMLELLNETIGEYKATSARTFKQYFDTFINDGGVLKLGVNDISDKTVKHEWTGTETVLARLYSLAEAFDAEVSIEPRLNDDYTLKEIRVNVYEEHDDDVQGIGRDRTNEPPLRYGENIKSIRRTIDISDLYTAVRPLGNDGLTLAGVAYEELDSSGKVLYYSPSANTEIYAPQAMERYPSHVSNSVDQYILEVWQSNYKYEATKISEQVTQLSEQIAKTDKKDSDKNKIESIVEKLNEYIKDLGLTYNRDTDTLSMTIAQINAAGAAYKRTIQDRMYRAGLSRLKKACKPKTTYEVDGFGNIDIGDTVMIVDESFEPELYLRARVVEQLISFTQPDRNKTTFDNFTAFNSKIDSSLTRIQERLSDAADAAEDARIAAAVASAAADTAQTAASSASSTASKALKKNVYAVSQTIGSTAAKVAAITTPEVEEYEPEVGDKVTVLFSAENTAETPTLSLQVNETTTAAAPILAYDGTAFDASVYSWNGDTAVDLVYNGEAWLMPDPKGIADAHAAQVTADAASAQAAKTNNYFWHDEDGAHVATVEGDADNGPNVLITGNGLYIRVDSRERAHFLSEGMRIYGDDNASTEIAHLGYGEGNSENNGKRTAPYYCLGLQLSSSDVYSPEIEYKVGDIVLYNDLLYICRRNNTGKYPENNLEYWARKVGNYSLSEGVFCVAAGVSSHAEGTGSKGIGDSSHAEGRHTIASGFCSHAEGNLTVASGTYSHAQGTHTKATGERSHAQGEFTLAQWDNQFVLGKYNDNSSNNVFEIGDGTSESNRHNLFSISVDVDIHTNGFVDGTVPSYKYKEGFVIGDEYINNLDYATEGFWTYTNAAENKPNSAGGSLIVLEWSNGGHRYVYQIACPNNAAGNAVLYTRIKTSTGWGDWTRNIGQQDITHYVHEQAVSADTWDITHNLGYYPSVTVVDSAGNMVKGEVEYLSANELKVGFIGSFTGKAYLN